MRSKALETTVKQLAQDYRLWARLPAEVEAIVLLPEVPEYPIHPMAARPEFPRGVCRSCGCTEDDACLIYDRAGELVGPCGWLDREQTRCSACGGAL